MNIECPKCFTVHDAAETLLDVSKLKDIEYYNKVISDIQTRKTELKQLKDKVYNTIYNSTKSINIGFIGERVAPLLPSFRFKHFDCRSTGGDPIDYIIYDGLHKQKVEYIYFVDVKTGNATLTKRQREIKHIINIDKNVKFRTYNIPSV